MQKLTDWLEPLSWTVYQAACAPTAMTTVRRRGFSRRGVVLSFPVIYHPTGLSSNVWATIDQNVISNTDLYQFPSEILGFITLSLSWVTNFADSPSLNWPVVQLVLILNYLAPVSTHSAHSCYSMGKEWRNPQRTPNAHQDHSQIWGKETLLEDLIISLKTQGRAREDDS